MHILLIGNGGREHAIAWKLASSKRVTRLSVAPGNPGTQGLAHTENIALDVSDNAAVVQYACDTDVALAVIGPEAPLVAGLADALRIAGVPTVGPGADGAQLEGSKAYAKDFMARHNIPTAAYGSFTTEAEALAMIEAEGVPIVIKADGLAAGKGVVVAHQMDEARAAVKDMLSGARHGEAGHRVVIESFLAGEEASFIALIDGKTALPFATSQDHKARDEGGTGPNTGGMGAYSPAPVVSDAVHQRVVEEILEPSLQGLNADGIDFRGFLYVGLMIDDTGAPRVVEYNVRLGDPETQPLLVRLNSDLVDLFEATAAGNLADVSAQWSEDPAIGIVVAAGNYPAGSSKGVEISGIDEANASECIVFHAGTRMDGETLVTNGGRIVCVTATGTTLAQAKARADAGAAKVQFEGARFRADIGHRALK